MGPVIADGPHSTLPSRHATANLLTFLSEGVRPLKKKGYLKRWPSPLVKMVHILGMAAAPPALLLRKTLARHPGR